MSETLYATSHITGSCSTPANANGSPDGTFTTDTSNTSWASRWAIGDPSGALDTVTQTITVRARKDSASDSGLPTLTATLYENGSSVATLFTAQGVPTDGSYVDLQGTFNGSAISDASAIEVYLAATGHGTGGNKRTIQVDSITLTATVAAMTPITGTSALDGPTGAAEATGAMVVPITGTAAADGPAGSVEQAGGYDTPQFTNIATNPNFEGSDLTNWQLDSTTLSRQQTDVHQGDYSGHVAYPDTQYSAVWSKADASTLYPLDPDQDYYLGFWGNFPSGQQLWFSVYQYDASLAYQALAQITAEGTGAWTFYEVGQFTPASTAVWGKILWGRPNATGAFNMEFDQIMLGPVNILGTGDADAAPGAASATGDVAGQEDEYLSGYVSGNVPTPTAALGAPDGSFTTPTTAAWDCMWEVADPAGTLDTSGTITCVFTMRKSGTGGAPTVNAFAYDGTTYGKVILSTIGAPADTTDTFEVQGTYAASYTPTAADIRLYMTGTTSASTTIQVDAVRFVLPLVTSNDVTGTAALDGAAGAASASGSITVPETSGTADADGPPGSASASGTAAPVETSGTAALDGVPGSASASGSYDVPSTDGTSALDGSPGSASASGAFLTSGTGEADGPTGSASATGDTGAPTLDGSAALAGSPGSASATGSITVLSTSGTADVGGLVGSAWADATGATAGTASATGAPGSVVASGSLTVPSTTGSASFDGSTGSASATGTSGAGVISGTGSLDASAGTASATGDISTPSVTGSATTAGIVGALVALGEAGPVTTSGTATAAGLAGSVVASGGTSVPTLTGSAALVAAVGGAAAYTLQADDHTFTATLGARLYGATLGERHYAAEARRAWLAALGSRRHEADELARRFEVTAWL